MNRGGRGRDEARRAALRTALACVGASAMASQILVLREFLSVFSGNELTLGLFLCAWLLLGGAGGLVGARSGALRHPDRWWLALQVAFGLLPAATLVWVRFLRVLVAPGVMLGAGQAVGAAFAALAPLAFLAGCALPLAARRIGHTPGGGTGAVGTVYVWDAVGSVVGGVLFSFVLAERFEPFEGAGVLLVLNWAAAGWDGTGRKRGTLWAAAGAAGAALVIAGWTSAGIEHATSRWLYPGQEIMWARSTPYGRLAQTRVDGQHTVYRDGVPLATAGDTRAAEETVHFALAQVSNPHRVLLIGGGATGALGEIARHGVKRIDHVETDAALASLSIRPAGGPEIRGVVADPRAWLRGRRAEYDAILVSMPDPGAISLNRYYTREFFLEAKRALVPGGVLGFGLGAAENYADTPLRIKLSSVARTLESVFAHVLVVPGPRAPFLGSDRPLDAAAVGRRLRERGVQTLHVNESTLRGRVTPERLAATARMAGMQVPLNRDDRPVTLRAQLEHWMGHFGETMAWPLMLALALGLGVAAVAWAGSNRAASVAVAASGFAGIGLEIVLLLAYQIAHGSLYHRVGLIATAFLLGAAWGAHAAGPFAREPARARAAFLRLDLGLALFALLLAPALPGLGAIGLSGAGGEPIGTTLSATFTALAGFIVGAQFPPASVLLHPEETRADAAGVEKTAGRLFALDFLGAGLGALVAGVFLVPGVGLAGTCLILGGVKLVTFLGLCAARASGRTGASLEPGGREPVLAAGIVLLVAAALGVLIVADDTAGDMYAFSFAGAYHGVVLGFLAWGVAHAMGMRWGATNAGPIRRWLGAADAWLARRTGLGGFRWTMFAGMATAVFYPIFRCYFKVPYVFCHVCPRRCVFGYLRPYLVPMALIMNVEGRHWCRQACPLGTLQQCQGALTRLPPRRTPRLLVLSAALALCFVALGYFAIHAPGRDQAPEGWYDALFRNAYAPNPWALGAAGALLLLGFVWRRPFCDALCPIGTVSEAWLRLERRFFDPTRIRPADAPRVEEEGR